MRASWLGIAAVLVAGATVGAGAEPAKVLPSPTKPVACGQGGIEATVALAYQANVLGPIAGTYVDLSFDPPLDIPSDPKDLRPRLTSLLSQVTIGTPTRKDKRLRVGLITKEQGIQPATALKVRFDCPPGSRIAPLALSCATAEVTNAAGLPMDDALAREVRCLVTALDPVKR